jgi:hypothetical protein
MTLFEKIYTKAHHKIYYHGSPVKFDSFELRADYNPKTVKAFFVSNSLPFAASIGYFNTLNKGGWDGIIRVYHCIFTSPPNVFNASNDTDRKILETMIREKYKNDKKDMKKFSQDFEIKYENYNIIDAFIRRLYTSPRDYSIIEKPGMLSLVKEAGYDAFAIEEKLHENLGVLKKDYIKIFKMQEFNKDQLVKELGINLSNFHL